MAQEYYSFMMNRFFETLFIQLMANVQVTWRCMAVREVPKDVLKMASGLILLSGLAGHRRQLCIIAVIDGRRVDREYS